MSEQRKIVVVAGANGELGKLLCNALLSCARMDGQSVLVRGLVRKGRTGDAAALPPRAPDGAAGQALVLEPVDYQSEEDLARVCAGAWCVVSTLQGLEEVIVGAQSRLLQAALQANARRFIPSDFSGDFTKLPVGSHRNFDLRRRFHEAAAELIGARRSSIEFTSIFQGGFTELLGSGWVLFNYKKQRIEHFGSADNRMEFTSWQNTAEFTAAAALDERATPRHLYPAGQVITPRQAQSIAQRVTGAPFGLKRVMPAGMLRVVIALMRFFKPGQPGEVMPLWVAMQYGYCGALGLMSPASIDNDRYPGIAWQGVDEVIRKAYTQARAGAT